MAVPKKIHAKNWAETDIIQPNEIMPVSWDFAEELDAGEEISTESVKAYNKAGDNVTTTVIQGSVIADGDATKSKIIVVLQSMTDTERYRIVIEATVGASKKPTSTLIVPCEEF